MKGFLSFFLLFFFLHAAGQKWVTDVPPVGEANLLPVEGGSLVMKIDSTTPLLTLVHRLKNQFDLMETGKGYWIGYNTTMFSIAATKTAAIPLLVELIDTTTQFYLQLNALYTLHLIGIESTIAARWEENFTCMEARRVLLAELSKPRLRPVIVELLIRDPKYSDIPAVMKIIESDSCDINVLNNFITRFALNLPIHQVIPDSFFTKLVFDYKADYEEHLDEKEDSFMNVLFRMNQDKIVIDSSIFQLHHWKQLIDNAFIHYEYENEKVNQLWVSMTHFLYKTTNVDYLEKGGDIQYYLENGKVYICSQETARRRLLNWWHHLDDATKAVFNKDESPKNLASGRSFGFAP